MLQEDGLQMCQETLWSSDRSIASSAMLLISHLLWDEEWRTLLAGMAPPLEEAAVKWGAFAAASIVRLAQKKKAKEDKEKWQYYDAAAQRNNEYVLSLMRNDPAALAAHQQQRQQQVTEEDAQRKNEVKFDELEMPGNQTWRTYMLNRSMLLMCTMMHDPAAPRRIVDAGETLNPKPETLNPEP